MLNRILNISTAMQIKGLGNFRATLPEIILRMLSIRRFSITILSLQRQYSSDCEPEVWCRQSRFKLFCVSVHDQWIMDGGRGIKYGMYLTESKIVISIYHDWFTINIIKASVEICCNVSVLRLYFLVITKISTYWWCIVVVIRNIFELIEFGKLSYSDINFKTRKVKALLLLLQDQQYVKTKLWYFMMYFLISSKKILFRYEKLLNSG